MGMRSVHDSHIGDTFHHPNFTITPLPGFKPAKPMVKLDITSRLLIKSLPYVSLGAFPMINIQFCEHSTLKANLA
jgi:hypothetical protein